MDEVQQKVVDLRKSASNKKKSFSEEMIRECLVVIETGDIEDLFEIIPKIGVLRDPRFHEPLLALLNQEDIKRREFAAYSMGAIRDRIFLEPLKKAFLEARQLRGFGAQELQVAIIEAIGAIGDDAAVDFFLPLLKSCCDSEASREGKGSRNAEKMSKWIVESLGAIAQQGGKRSVQALLELAGHQNPEIQAQAVSELSVAYWHRPNEVDNATLEKMYELTTHQNPAVAESALSALQNLADVGCVKAESFFVTSEEEE